MDGASSEGRPSDRDAWWTLGEAAERAAVSHGTIRAWIDAGELTVRDAWREGVGVRVVRAEELVALAPGAGAAPAGAPLAARALHLERGPSRLGSAPAAPASGTPDLVPPDDERPWEAELRREVERLRREVRELRAARDELDAELRRSEVLRRVPPAPRVTAPEPAHGTLEGERGLAAWTAAIAGLALGLAGAAGWRALRGNVVQAAGRDGAPAREIVEGRAALTRGAAPEVLEAFSLPFDGADGRSVDAPVADGREEAKAMVAAAGVDAPAPADEPAPTTDEGGGPDESADDLPALPAAPPRAAAPSPRAFPVNLRQVDPTAYLDVAADASSCAYSVLWRGGDPEGQRLRAALGPCIGEHNAAGQVAGTHRVDGAACCAHHAFVERMTAASRETAALARIVEEAEAAAEEGTVPPLVRLRAERSAKRFLVHALVLERGQGDWVAAGIDEGTGDHAWLPDAAGDPLLVRLRSWVTLEEGAQARRFELDVRIDDGPDGDRALGLRWIDR